MHRHGIGAIMARPHRVADSRHGLPIAPNLIDRNFRAAAANRIWLADITYVSTADGCCTWRRSWTSVNGQRTFRENVQISLGDAIVVRGSAAIGIVIGPSRRAAAVLGLRRICERARADVFRDESGVLAEPIARSLDLDNNCVVKQSIKQCCGRFGVRIIAPLS